MRLNVKNRTIFEGDNLDILRGVNSDSVDLIYLDPPFNSNRNYSAPIGSEAAGAAFKDSWTLSDVDNAWVGEIAEKDPALYNVIQASEYSHGKGMKSYLIMMAVRLLELKRVLKDTGSIYLHVDATASHYLKLIMDSIFGTKNFRNEIVWRRHTSVHGSFQHAPKQWGTMNDLILYYVKSSHTPVSPYVELTEEERNLKFNLVDEEGRRYYDDSSHIYNTPNMGARPNQCYTWRGYTNPHASGWRLSKKRLEEEYQKGNFVILPDGKLQRRKYENDYRGQLVGNVWIDIKPTMGKERTGYPTQKPLALLERVIRASSNEGDVVLDPFCGCATTCVSAEMLGRQWVGIDLSPLAGKIVVERLQKVSDEDGLLKGGKLPKVIHRTDLPRRTDREALPDYRTHKHVLYGEQEGNCKGCGVHFPFQNMTVDHLTPRSKGGGDHKENLQLLCNSCNSRKGSGTQAELIVRLREAGILYRTI